MRNHIIIDPCFKIAGKMDHLLIVNYPADDRHLQNAADKYHSNECSQKPCILFLIKQFWEKQVVSNVYHSGQVCHFDKSDFHGCSLRIIILVAQKIPYPEYEHPEKKVVNFIFYQSPVLHTV